MSESVQAILCLVVPALVTIWFMFILFKALRGRYRRSNRSKPVYHAPPIAVTQTITSSNIRTAQSIAHSLVSIAQAVQTLNNVSVSVVSQVSYIAQNAIHAVGYLIAQLVGAGEVPILRTENADGTLHVLRHKGSYQMKVRYQRNPPDNYDGAQVAFLDPPERVQLNIRLANDNFQIANNQEISLDVLKGQTVEATFDLIPQKEGVNKLSIDIYQGNRWAQRLDLDVNVFSKKQIQELIQKRRPDDNLESVNVLETNNTILALSNIQKRDLNLNISYTPGKVAGQTFIFRASDGISWRNLNNKWSEADLAEENIILQETLSKLKSYIGDNISLSDEQVNEEKYKELIKELAIKGNAAFLRLFPDEQSQKFILHAIETKPNALIEIDSDRFFIPWELLYDAYDEYNIQASNFWGMRYNISRILTDIRQSQSPIITIASNAIPELSLFANPELTEVIEQEVPYFQNLHRSGKIYLWDWLNDSRLSKDNTSLQNKFFVYSREKDSQIVHFACHAVVDKKYSLGSYLLLDSNTIIRIEDMMVNHYLLQGSPIVILNACGTGVRDALKTSGFVRIFLQVGGRGVLATECDVYDTFASRFIQILYDRFLNNRTLGEALIESRKIFLEKYNNPLGLLYASYAPLETRLDRGSK